MRDYFSDNGQLALYVSKAASVGYCVYYYEGDALRIEECLTDPPLYHFLLSALAGKTGIGRIHAKLPPDIRLPGKVLPQNVAAFTDPNRGADAVTRLFSPDGLSGKCFCVDEY